MARLSKYRAMREFSRTPEPAGKTVRKKGLALPRFCVQRHSARRLHFDLRLELDGVLLSFAVPKEPSMDPNEKRLAIHVEDHPLDYIDFEGTIPAGNYGAGEVEIWDRGTYQADEKAMRAGLKTGHMSFELVGNKLKGHFSLIKLKRSQKEEWIFFKSGHDEQGKLNQGAKKSAFPKWFSPMLAQLIEKPFDSKDWLFEIKWDGFRATAFVDKNRTHLWSRNHKSFNDDFPKIITDLKELGHKVVLDGEIVVLDRKGISRFDLLQSCHQDPKCDPCYMIFDLLYADGIDLRERPLIERKALLVDILAASQSSRLRLSDHIEGQGTKFFKEAQKVGLEGIVGKRKDSSYVSQRSSDWVKIKTGHRQEFVVAGFTMPQNGRAPFGALILGTYSQGALQFCGRVGTGFSKQMIEQIYQKMKPLIRKKCPFEQNPSIKEHVIWLKPQLLAEASFAEWTAQGRLRHPVFVGLRSDKEATEAKREVALDLEQQAVPTSNLQKVFWKKEGYTKGDLLLYYETVAPFMLPHLKSRPATLIRFPDGIHGESFFQKHIEGAPNFLKTAVIDMSAKNDKRLLIDNLQSLLYVANLAAIEIHPMLSRVKHLESPDFLVLDLDPEAVPFQKVVQVAQAAHDLLDEVGMPNFCKTSGSRGLHIYVPLADSISHEQSRYLAQLLAAILRDRLPALISLQRSPQKRQRRVYVDFLQNARDKSMVAPYSLRALPHAPVSTPLKWSEVTEDLDPLDFNILSVPKRLAKIGDIFAEVLRGGIDLNHVLERLEAFRD